MADAINRLITVSVSNQTSDPTIDKSRLREAVTHVLESNSIGSATIGVAVVSDEKIHLLNRKFLQHDYATDVLSFPLDGAGDTIEGEIAVSLDTAARQAEEYNWKVADELLLYVIHGTLHLVGYRDHSEATMAEMRSQEIAALAHFGLRPHYHDSTINI